MPRNASHLFVALTLFHVAVALADDQPRTRRLLNHGWRFHLETPEEDASQSNYDDSNWQQVTVPHSHRLYSENLDNSNDTDWQKEWHRHVGWYRRDLEVSPVPGKRYFLEFEGAHQVTDCWVNGQHVGQHAIGGYTPFHFDVTRFLLADGPNQVTLRVDNRYNPDIPPDYGRHDYIMPGGLYRDVYLVVTDGLHITFPWQSTGAGIFVHTPECSSQQAVVSVRVGLRNDHDHRFTGEVQCSVLGAEQQTLATSAIPFNVAAGDDLTLDTQLELSQPHLWSLDDPYLHHLRVTVMGAPVAKKSAAQQAAKPLDEVSERFGVRWFAVSAAEGITLNGKPVELIGANRHQQYPYIGNAVPDSLHRYDMQLLKQAGMNTVRLSHYPQDNAILDACDELGILVTEEPPTWIVVGSARWIDNLNEAHRRMIRNHRNHPSVFAWAVGINHLGYRDHLFRAAREEDPTRWTHANAAEWGESWQLKKGNSDLYGEMGFEHPETVIKDEFQFTIEHSGGIRGMQQVASARRRPQHLGLCVWELFDNHSFRSKTGETKIVRSGILDLYRQPKDQYFWYLSELSEHPMIHIVNRKPKPDEPIVIYTNCDSLRIFVNGETIERSSPTADPLMEGLHSPPFRLEQSWKTGQLRVVGFVGGKKVAEAKRLPPGTPHHLTIDLGGIVEPPPVTPNTSELLPVFVRVRDAAGTVVPGAAASIELRIEGPAEVLGERDDVGANPVRSRSGYAPFFVRMTGPGPSNRPLRITAHATGLESASLAYQ